MYNIKHISTSSYRQILSTPTNYLCISDKIYLINKSTGNVESSIDNPLNDSIAVMTFDGLYLIGNISGIPAIAKINHDLTYDKKFALNGLFSQEMSHEGLFATVIDIQSRFNTSYVLVRSINDYIIKLINGKLDLSFGIYGKLKLMKNAVMKNIIIDWYYKKIISIGSINGKFIMSRYSIDGIIDKQFGFIEGNTSNEIGSIITNTQSDDIKSIFNNNKILVTYIHKNSLYVTKINTDGVADNNFGTSGVAKISYNIKSIDNIVSDINSNIYISGILESDSAFTLCMKPNGIINDSFFSTGIYMMDTSSISTSMCMDDSIIIATSSEVIKITQPAIVKTWFGYFTS